MPRPPETDDQSIATDEELRLLDLLYGELDADEAEQARREVDENDELAGELEGLTSTRSLFAELPDAEPPQAISAKLLQAAAAHAPRPSRAAEQHGGGVWSWFSGLFKPIVQYPGLAAVASLVLVVGIAGTLYMAGKGRTTEPKAESATELPAGEPTRAWEEKTAGDKRAQKADSPGRYADVDDDSAPLELEATEEAKSEAPSAPKKTGTKQKGMDDSRETRGNDSGRSRGRDGDGVTVTSDSTIDLGGALDEGEADTDKVPAKKPSEDPAPPPEAEPSADDSIAVDVPSPDIKSVPKKDEDSSKARDLHDRAKTAAKRGDCAATNRYGSQIRSIDVGYYNDVYLRDATVKKCAATQDSQKTKK